MDLDLELNLDLESRDFKIKAENRKRIQVYTILEILFSANTYLDFFSNDAFDILVYSNCIALASNKTNIIPEYLFQSLFKVSSHITKLLEEHDISESNFLHLINEDKAQNNNKLKLIYKELLSFFNNQDNKKLSKTAKLSSSVISVLELATNNAETKYKNPVITGEILLLAMLEDTENLIAKKFRDLFRC